ncbi:SusC/RagA family TonB-linked outer membrane protein [Dyadobacter sp. CY312]|uniref:SusC/RagA family TonB-linked outer membrane protein n=1 Tax=Dyadobacter sp. CY312 TaxID=2907303 RepID=UPI001F3B22B5|nr:SusC/RagA family TonB-linked outer membrane protein [Dyadobacter sp. CY312]MCE7040129.1 SusC/RagA family TonB-linked outer membrane protein [Dyadobacter sp. CY312]
MTRNVPAPPASLRHIRHHSGLSPIRISRILRLTMIFFVSVNLCASGFGYSQKVSVSEKNASLEKVFKSLKKQSGYTFFFDEAQLRSSKPVDLNVKNVSLEDALEKCFANQDLTYTIVGKTVVVKAKEIKKGVFSPANSDKSREIQTQIGGTITDEKGHGLPGVNVLEKGTSNGTSTDIDGKFRLTVADERSVLILSYIGYDSQEIPVGTKSEFTISMTPDSRVLDEVVVTALGIKREEKSLGYAVQKVAGKELQTVKGVDIATSLTGRVAGMVILNSTEFNTRPTIELRGENPLLVIDGVPYGNMTLRDVPTDDIETMDILKGATASALYGSRGGSGAVIITTKKGKGKGLSVDVNVNTMATLGYIAIPKVQTSYGHGINGKIANDYVWGPKLDIGQTAEQWNPITKQYEEMPLVSSGKNNLKNFLQTGMISNNNINVTQSGENGFFRVGVNHIFNKGQFPNSKLNMTSFTTAGELRVGDKFTIEAHTGYTRKTAPQIWGSGYGNQGYLYQILMWTGVDYDIRQYKDYWVTPNESQNWLYDSWYDNPYLIAHEKLNGINQNKLNASLSATYNFTKDLKLLFRSGYDFYSDIETMRNPIGINSTRSGFYIGSKNLPFNSLGTYGINKNWGLSTNNDLLLMYNKKVKDWGFDGLVGGTVYYYQDRNLGAGTQNGLSVPGWYSLGASLGNVIASESFKKRQINSVFGKASISWRDAIFVDITGRNDWSSTQPAATRSYFYPSVATSVLLSEFLKMPNAVDLWKVRASFAVDKSPLGVYESNRTYGVSPAVWGTLNSASYPNSLLGTNLLPNSQRTWEIGTGVFAFGKRVHLDVAYFNKYFFNQQVKQSISSASGFATTLVNTKETIARRGLEITLDGSVVKNNDLEWHSAINYSFSHRYYVDLDPVYSSDNPWTKKGERTDYYTVYQWLRDKEGNIIHNNGLPMQSDYKSKIGYGDYNFSLGFINSLTYKNFSFNLAMDGRFGGLMFNNIWDKMFDTGSNPETDNQYRYDQVVNGLTNYVGKGVNLEGGTVEFDKYGTITSDSREYSVNNVEVGYQDYTQWMSGGEQSVQKQGFFKIREISVGYKIPSGILGKGIKNASISLTAQNVLLITKFKFSDPDVFSENLNAPSQRMVGMNIRLGF